MTPAQAIGLSEDLQHLKALRENRVWMNHILPEIRRRREEHRVAMRDMALRTDQRTEHITAWELCETMLEFLDKAEVRMRSDLREHDRTAAVIDRPWSAEP